VVAAVGVIAVIAGAAFVAVKVGQGESLNRASSDRVARVKDTTRVFAKHLLVGVGTGGQPRASRAAAHSARPSADFVSHTTPLTVAAELGIVGFALYVWLLVGAARLLDAVRRREAALGLGLGAAFLALFVHSLFYPGVLQDPIMWFVLAVGAGELLALSRPAPVAAERPAAPAPVAP
jgi:O-antigen ligase